MNEKITASDLRDLLRTGDGVLTTVHEFGSATVQCHSKDDLSILTISGVYSRQLSKEIERLAQGCRGNLGIEFKDLRVNPASGKKFDTSVLGLLKTLRDKCELRDKHFMLCSPPPELIDLLTLTGSIGSYAIAGREAEATGVRRVPPGRPSAFGAKPAAPPEATIEPEVVQKRIVNLNRSLQRTVSLEKGLDNAQKCVMRFLPSKAPEVEGYEFGFVYKSCEKVGGDFFDFVPLDDDHLGILIGDVSGHGLDAAILMGISKKVLHLRASEVGPASPREALARANRDLAPDFHRYSFVTVLYGILEFSTGRFTFSRAGHEPPVVFGLHAHPRVLESRGGALGARLEKGGGLLLEDKSVDLAAGEYVFLYTDGLPELRDARGALYTRERLLFSLGQVTPELTCPDALDAVLRSAQEFAEGAPQEDDITTILVCRRESGR